MLYRLFVFNALLILCGLVNVFASGETTALAFDKPHSAHLIPLPSTISGIVTGSQGAQAGATVQVQGTNNKTLTDRNGRYTLSGISGTLPINVTAWASGHYVGWTVVNPAAPDWKGGDSINITLKPLPNDDNSKYDWVSSKGTTGSTNCALCHREYTEWQVDYHAQAATNQRFLSLYTGKDIQGNEGQAVQYGSDGIPLPPDLAKPYHGPGFKLDTPDRAGNCATCHTPLVSKVPNDQNCSWAGCHTSLTIERSNGVIKPAPSPLAAHDEALEGISCDFCHKIGDVILDPKTSLPYANMPGILSLRLYRPYTESEQVFFGNMVDVTRPDSYLPLLSQSQFCAGCHFGVFGGVVGMNEVKDGVVIYNSYGEWLNSPYSDPNTGKTCQQCHMPVSEAKFTAFPERGGITRDYTPMHTHTMLGSRDESLLQNTVTLKSTAERDGDQLRVQVSITNDKAGHSVPTDIPIRSMILVVEVLDSDGKSISLSAGPTNPTYSGDYGGLPGKTFAKVLRDNWTGEMPTAAFWRPVTIVEDSRLKAMATDTTRYTFAVPAGKAATVNVKLIYRRAFSELSKQKGWNDPDILMAHQTVQIPAN